MSVGKEDKKRGWLMACLLLGWHWAKDKVCNPAAHWHEGGCGQDGRL